MNFKKETKKKLLCGVFTVMLLSGAGGCNRDMIDLNPVTNPWKENFYKTSSDFLLAVNAIYGVLQTDGISDIYMFGDLPSDDTFANTSRMTTGENDFDNFQIIPSSGASAGILRNRWNNCYVGISYANVVLDRIQNAEFDAKLKDEYAGQAKFLRAYFYFLLVQTFGDVPFSIHEIRSVSETYTFGRTPVAEIYPQIEQDLRDAIVQLPPTYTGANAGRVTSIAARGLLARVLLFEGKHAEALPVLEPAVTTPGTYGLLSDYASIFKYYNGNNKEILFAIQYSGTAVGETNSETNSFYAQNVNQPTSDIRNAYSTGDKRRDSSLVGPGNTSTSKVLKFRDPTPGLRGGTDYPILRYADILLMYAECLNETGNTNDAITYVNKIRERAFGNTGSNYQNTNPSATLTYVSGPDDLRSKILLERRLELSFEGLRFWDLVRMDRLDILNTYFENNQIKINNKVLRVEPYQKLFPIPQSIIDVNRSKITQNFGYPH